MNKLAFVRSGLKHCDKSQSLRTMQRILRLVVTKLYKPSYCLLKD